MQDIHTHLYWHSYDADRDAVVERARAAGVREMLVIGCTVDESHQAIGVAERYEDIYAAVGIHPHEFNESGISDLESWVCRLKSLAQNSKKVRAIGECGLDYYSHIKALNITDEQKRMQREGFVAQIALARGLMLPLIVHCRSSSAGRDAYEDMFDILKAEGGKLKAVLHCYMGDTEVTRKFLTLPNVCFSFTGNITYPTKKAAVGTKDDLAETVKLVPLERIFVETDCPFLAPQSHRGERNEPAHVAETLARVAELHGVGRAEVEYSTDVCFQKVFFPDEADPAEPIGV